MRVYVVVCFKVGTSGSIHVEAKKVFSEENKEKATELVQLLNDSDGTDDWAFVSETELV